jgi:arginyl-tRNA synthetase
VLEFAGDSVIRQNHLGDWGTQFGRVMLGLWYASAAAYSADKGVLDRWMAEAQTQNPEAQRRLLAELVPWHQRRLSEDLDGKTFFEPFLSQEPFPDLERMQALYQFATSVTSYAAAREFSVTHDDWGSSRLDELPKLIAWFVQQNGTGRHRAEHIAWERCVKRTMEQCYVLYERLKVRLSPQHEYGESRYRDRLDAVVADLLKANIARHSDGAVATGMRSRR